MSTLTRCFPSDRGLEFLLVVTLVVALVSSAAWLIARRLAGHAALRHLVLFSALICCLASPALAWFCAAAGLTLVSIPILCGEQAGIVSGAEPIETEFMFGCAPPRPSADPPAIAAELPLPLVSFRGIITGVMFVWASGALLMLARLAWNCRRVVQLRRSAHPLQCEARQLLLREVTAKLGMHRVPLLLVSARTIAPMAVGFGRPAVILPEHLLGAVSHNELRDILLHEMAHLQRRDQQIVLLQELAGALYWPIVSVHALHRELQQAREELCDNFVLADRNAIGYGETLLHVAELLVNARPMRATVGIFGGQGELERRVAGLIDPRRNTTTATGRKAACMVMFIFITFGAIGSTTRFTASASATPAARDTAPQAAWPIK